MFQKIGNVSDVMSSSFFFWVILKNIDLLSVEKTNFNLQSKLDFLYY